jgi:hypothetical protein
VSPYGILKVKTADDEESRVRSRLGDTDWYDGRQHDRAEALKQYSYRPPEDDSDCFTVEPFGTARDLSASGRFFYRHCLSGDSEAC